MTVILLEKGYYHGPFQPLMTANKNSINVRGGWRMGDEEVVGALSSRVNKDLTDLKGSLQDTQLVSLGPYSPLAYLGERVTLSTAGMFIL